MNSSKSAQLIMQAFNFKRQGKKYIVFKPSIDTRDGDYVVSRALDQKLQATVVGKDDYGLMTNIVRMTDIDFIFVDESQFLTANQVEELAKISIEYEIPVFAYGLLMSFNGELFEGSKRAIECGFTLHELKMQCDYCTSKATHHLLYADGKVVKEGSGIHVGDEEFKSVCYECYYKHMQ